MAGTAFSKVTVDNADRKNSRFSYGHAYSGSCGFGEVLPIHCVKLVPGSSHTVSARSVLRLDPMVAPTSQGKITCKQWHSFVGLSDLFRDHGAFLTKQPHSVASGVTTLDYLPRMKLADLSVYCLVGCRFTVYRYDPNTEKYTQLTDNSSINADINVLDADTSNWVQSVTTSQFDARWPNYSAPGINWIFRPAVFGLDYAGHSLPCGNVAAAKIHFFNINPVNIDKCDYVFERKITSGGTDHYYAFAVNLSTFGKRLLNILLALGFGVDFKSTRNVDLTRLFAFYVAYYGSFGLSLYTNYESTACCQFLRGYENGRNGFQSITCDYPTGTFGQSYELNDIFAHFIQNIVDAYVTEPVDYISAFRKKDVSGIDDIGFVRNIVRVVGTPANSQTSFGGSPDQNQPGSLQWTTGSLYINNMNHTQVDADLLKLLYKSVNRQTVAGRRIAELLRQGGYGSYVDEQKSHFLGYDEFDVDVSDVNATADGVNTVTGKQSNLGDYVGKGFGTSMKQGKNDPKFECSTDEFGYWITLCAVVPESSYVQGADQTVYDYQRTEQYNREYDSVGYEIHDKSVIKAGSDYVPWDKNVSGSNSASQEAFGLIPRGMRYKVGRSVLCGNFKLRSRRDAYLPFVMSRWIDSDDIHLIEAPSSGSIGVDYHMRKSIDTSDLPIAGNAWRYVNFFPWLSNFERIFAFSNAEPYSYDQSNMLARWRYCVLREDFFMLFVRIQHNCWAPMLQIEDSWSTTDDNDGKGTAMTQA